jgi:competence protein ComEA
MKALIGSLIAGLFLSVSAWAAVDLNAATQSELEAVKGIGPAKAKAIVDHRAKNGPFKSVDDLANVKGFGKASVGKLKNELAVGSEAAKPAAKK